MRKKGPSSGKVRKRVFSAEVAEMNKIGLSEEEDEKKMKNGLFSGKKTSGFFAEVAERNCVSYCEETQGEENRMLFFAWHAGAVPRGPHGSPLTGRPHHAWLGLSV